MDGVRSIEKLRLMNILSFGSDGVDIVLEPLNVLIGPNGSGKSNLLEALSILKSASDDWATSFRNGGGVIEWFWKGAQGGSVAEISVSLPLPGATTISYQLTFAVIGAHPQIIDERIESNSSDIPGENAVFYRYRRGRPIISMRTDINAPLGGTTGRIQMELAIDDGNNNGIRPEESVLAQAINFAAYPEITVLGLIFKQMQQYSGFDTGRTSALRLPQLTDLPNSFLQEDGSNLGLVLSDLVKRGMRQQITEYLQRFYEPTRDFAVHIEGGTVQFYLLEEGLNQPVSAMRLSDGTLRYLCLLAILLHPSPPLLICIEEPETGLHPDILPTIAELLVEASQRTQLIVTTHSETLISALGDYPEAIVVCERDEQGTRLERLEREPLQEWLAKYTLGKMWRMGHIGGNRS